MKSKRALFWIIIFAFLAGLLLYPFETTVVPEWKIRVVDESGKPVGNVLVNQGWRDHSIELHRSEQGISSDSQGYVYFPRRAVRAGLLHRLIGRAVASLNPHGETRIETFVYVVGPYLSRTDTVGSTDASLPHVIIIRPQP